MLQYVLASGLSCSFSNRSATNLCWCIAIVIRLNNNYLMLLHFDIEQVCFNGAGNSVNLKVLYSNFTLWVFLSRLAFVTKKTTNKNKTRSNSKTWGVFFEMVPAAKTVISLWELRRRLHLWKWYLFVFLFVFFITFECFIWIYLSRIQFCGQVGTWLLQRHARCYHILFLQNN